MAEHLRHEMARAGVAVRPLSIQTLAGFLDQWAPGLTAPTALVQLAIQDALEAVQPARFRAVAEFKGFRAALDQIFDEIQDHQNLDEILGPDLSDVFRDAQTRIRPFFLRKERLRSAAEAITAVATLPDPDRVGRILLAVATGTGVGRGSGFADRGDGGPSRLLRSGAGPRTAY